LFVRGIEQVTELCVQYVYEAKQSLRYFLHSLRINQKFCSDSFADFKGNVGKHISSISTKRDQLKIFNTRTNFGVKYLLLAGNFDHSGMIF